MAKQGQKEINGQVVDEGQSIEAVVNTENDFKELFENEKFMNEILEIEVATTTNDNEPPNFILSVNGITQPCLRGVPIKMRRMFVEVLARCKETKYKQAQRDMSNPESANVPIGTTAWTYPFNVLHDPNPKGRAWLAAVKAEPA